MTHTIRFGRRNVEIAETLVDKVVGYFSPRAGLDRRKARTMLALSGGYMGGKRNRRGMRFWRPSEGSADRDIIPDLPDLRGRSRDMVRNVPVATGAVAMQVNSIVGDGLALQPSVDADILGMDIEEKEAAERQISREWKLFCKTADFTRVQHLNEIQCTAFRAVLESGDLAIVRRFRKDPGDVYGTKLQMVEADRMSNPGRGSDTPTLVAGVEFNQDGVPVKYNFSNRHPNELHGTSLDWSDVPARDKDGRQLVIHLYDRQRPDQSRGVPYLAPVMERLKQLGDYTDSEVQAALISSLFTVFVTSGIDDDGNPIIGESGASAGVDDDELKLQSGAVLSLNPGEKIEAVDPKRPNDKFDPFVMAVLREVGVALDLPFELLIRHFTASYSASRAALETAWQFFRRRRSWLARRLCDVIYEWFMEEAIATERVVAPGFFADPITRQAWLGAQWTGPARMSIDPKRESDADKQDVEQGFKTISQVVIERTGGDWEEKHAQRVKEVTARRTANLEPAKPMPGSGVQRVAPPAPDDEDDEDEDEKEIA